MEQHRIGPIQHRSRLLAQNFRQGIITIARFGIVFEERSCRLDPPLKIVNTCNNIHQHFTHDQPHMAARHGIIADHRHAIIRQNVGDQRHAGSANFIGYPGIDTVQDNIVERARRIVLLRLDDVLHHQSDIFQTCGSRKSHPPRNGDFGQIEAMRLAFRPNRRE